MLESELFQVKAVYKGVDKPHRVFFFNILIDSIGKEHCLVSVGTVYMFAHDFSVVMKLALSLTVSSEDRKGLFTQSDLGLRPSGLIINLDLGKD